MDWSAANFDWNRARALLVTAEEGSFSAAARALGLRQSTLGRQVTALEEELGVTLFERVGHKLILTSTGLELVEQVRVMFDAATRLSLIATGNSESIAGVVRIAASEAMSGFVLPSLLVQIRKENPSIEFEVVVSNRSSDLRKREADIAVRHTRPSGVDLVAHLVHKENFAYLYATPEYLKSIGNPKTPEELGARAHVIGFDETDLLQKTLVGLGLPIAADGFPLRTENHLAQWALAKAGGGCCLMMAAAGDRDSQMVRALPDGNVGYSFPTWLVSHRELKTSRRIRVVFDRLGELLAEALGQDGELAPA